MLPRERGTKKSGAPFPEDVVEKVWLKAKPEGEEAEEKPDVCATLMRREDYGNRESEFGWEVDHISPVSKGGTDDLVNLQPLHWRNNLDKGEKSQMEWGCGVRTGSLR